LKCARWIVGFREKPGAKAPFWRGLIRRAKALRLIPKGKVKDKSESKDKDKSRFPSGMTTRRATTTAITAHVSEARRGFVVFGVIGS
jgi:hypothetical protein